MADSMTAALAELQTQLLGEKPRLQALIDSEQDHVKRHDLRGELNVIEMRLAGIERYGIDVLAEEESV